MKILLVTSEIPYPPTFGGAKLRSYQIMRELYNRHDIFLLSFIEDKGELIFEDGIKKICKGYELVERIPERRLSHIRYFFNPYWFYDMKLMHERIRRICAQRRFDLMHFDAPMAIYKDDCPTDVPKIICPADSRALARLIQIPQIKNIKDKFRIFLDFIVFHRFEKYFYPKFDACVSVAEDDKKYIKKLCPGLRVEVIPSGLDIDYFAPQNGAACADLLVFTGTMDYEPNIDAVCYFARDILPLIRKQNPKISFYNVGRNPVQEVLELESYEGVKITGFVEDIREYLAKASVFVCPMRLGTGIKNKVLEAMAVGKAVVLTSNAAKAIDARDGMDFLIADTPEEFSKAVLRLLKDESLREKIGKSARETVVRKYSLKEIGDRYEAFYNSLVNP